jgi:hypothetical protein
MRYDIVIIGGGPAGMMAAGTAGELGAKVLLLEKGSGTGTKLLMTGGGRCNITNMIAEPLDLKAMAARYGQGARFMRAALYEFGPEDVVRFFNKHGVKTRVEDNGRVMPVSNDARDVLDVLMKYMREGNVEVRLGAAVRDVVKKDSSIDSVVLASGEVIAARSFLIACGGMSYPASGSTGDGYAFAKSLGHSIVPPRPALTTVVAEGDVVKGLEGLSLSHVRVGLYKDNKKIAQADGDIIFTSSGLGGPVVMDMSRAVGAALPAGSVELRLDVVADLDFKALEQVLLKGFEKDARRLFKNSIGIVPQRLLMAASKLAGIKEDKKAGEVTREERKRLVRSLKEFTLRVRKVAGFERAFITAGGALLNEVDSKTMRSKIIDNLYFAGETLDVDGPTGGYNLQVCWSTGKVAGSAMAKVLPMK